MKPALIFFSVLTSLSLSFAPQKTPAVICRGKPLSIEMLPGPKMTGPAFPLRFGGTRQWPILGFPSENAVHLVIKTRDEFNDFWKQMTARVPPGQEVPPPEIDFSKEMVVVSALGRRPTLSYWTMIDGACEADGQVEVFVTNVDGATCTSVFPAEGYPADAVRIPRSDLPVVFRETQINCKQWQDLIRRSARGTG